ncbi:hypothetical protein D3C85_1224640 [compost metagenome]
MVRLELLFLTAAEVELVGVVRNVHFLATDQLVIEAILAAGEHLQLVEQVHPTLVGYRRVIGEFRCQLDAAHAWGVAPRAARLDLRVEVVGEDDQLPGATSRVAVRRPGAVVQLRISISLLDLVVRGLLHGGGLRGLGHRTPGIHHPTVGRRSGGVPRALVAQYLVPDDLVAVLR